MIILLGFLACGGTAADIADGTYTIDTASVILDTTDADDTIEALEGLTLVIEASEFTLTLDEEEVGSGELILRDEEDWAYGCPTNFSATSLKTYDLQVVGGIEVAGITYENPVLAPSCGGSLNVYISEYGEETGNYGCFAGVCLPMTP